MLGEPLLIKVFSEVNLPPSLSCRGEGDTSGDVASPSAREVAYELRELEQRNRNGDMVKAVSHVLAMRKKGKGFKDAGSGVRSKL